MLSCYLGHVLLLYLHVNLEGSKQGEVFLFPFYHLVSVRRKWCLRSAKKKAPYVNEAKCKVGKRSPTTWTSNVTFVFNLLSIMQLSSKSSSYA